jgi:spore germination cell wall hydrolase CwlJ-like protein
MKIGQNFKGWLTTFAVIGAASVIIPLISSQASSQRAQAQWAEAAADFRAAEPVSTAYAQRLSPRLKDLADVEALSSIGVSHRRWAEAQNSEFQCLAEAVYYEARSESRSGQLAVADVVKNRVKSKHYPDSICGVVYEGAERAFACQFSFACDGSMDLAPRGAAWQRSQEIAQLSLTGFVPDLTKNSTHYHTVTVEPNWANTLQYKATIGFHKFYRPSWRERNSGAASIFIAPPT